MAPAGTVPAQGDRALLVLTDLGASDPRAMAGQKLPDSIAGFLLGCIPGQHQPDLRISEECTRPTEAGAVGEPFIAMVPS